MKCSLISLLIFTAIGTSCNDKDDVETIKTDTVETTDSDFTLSSVAISNGELLDAYKCEKKVNDIENSIPLSVANVPEETNSLIFVMYHYPNSANTSDVNSYLLLWDVDASVTEIPYGTANTGDWFMGSNKDGTAISYTSPCSPSVGTHEYTIAVYAVSETPSSLPNSSSIDVTYAVLMDALTEVTIIEKAELTFNDVN